MMKQVFSKIMTVAALMAATLSSMPLLAQNEPAPGEGSRLLAHRGGRNEIDENTLEAFQHAFDSGCWALETDVRFTKDKELMILHDNDFKRMCGIDKAPEEMTAAEIKELRTTEGHKIPFLKDLLKLLKKYDGAYVEFELKCSDPDRYPMPVLKEYLDKAAKEIYSSKPSKSIYLMTSFDTRAMRYLGIEHPEADVMLITGQPCSPNMLEVLKSLGVKRLACRIEGSSKNDLEAAHKAGIRVNLWPTAAVETIHLAYLLGADYICTDIPAAGVKYIKENKLPVVTKP
jgi:glycerophosphoryl diester phosphodiesterase